MKKYLFLLPLFISLTCLNLSGIESSGHISLMEGDVKIVKTDGEMLKGKINYPLVTGDVILTGKSGRCELLLSNGTLLRLDNNSDIKLVSLLIESVTSNKKVTTLKLMSGSVYSMAQIYKNEILQIITPQISVKMGNRSTNLIRTSEKESSVRVVRGKVGVIYGDHSKIYIRSGELVIFPRRGKKYRSKIKSDDEFLSWNRSINKNFKKLHYGNSKIPDAVYIHSPGIVHFAEKWSTLYGEWEYNEFFGYVWKPADETFHGKRPFFDANYVRIDGELVLIPNQAWGWAPAHLGTWFWSTKQGWLWIPGTWERENHHLVTNLYKAFMLQFFTCRTSMLGGMDDLFTEYAKYSWISRFHITDQQDSIANISGSGIDELNTNKISPRIIDLKIKDKNIIGLKSGVKSDSRSKISNVKALSFKRDWNPDSRLSRRAGIKIVYDTKNNIVKFPRFKMSTRDLTGGQKLTLRKSIFNSTLHYRSSAYSSVLSGTGTTGTTGSISSGTISTGSGVGGGMSGHGNSGDRGGSKQN